MLRTELRKNSTNLWFGELTRFEGLPFLDGILSLLSPCHPLKVMILLHDEYDLTHFYKTAVFLINVLLQKEKLMKLYN